MKAIEYIKEVRREAAKVTWPTRKETMISTVLVLALAVIAAIFFLIVDQGLAWGIRQILGLGA